MRFALVCLVVALAACTGTSSAAERVSVSSELARMRSVDHLYRPQNYRLVQYSGFDRKGGNPDRVDCLYTENKWRVVADHKGPGVVSRIWTAHGERWGIIQVEVDDRVIFTGPANLFFQQDKIPFMKPFSEKRNTGASDRVTAEGEVKGVKNWAVSYVPIPFEKRFRYLQRDVLYANINIKALPPEVEVESFVKADWTALKDEYAKTAAIWQGMDLYDENPTGCKTVHHSIALKAAPKGGETVSEVAALTGPGIIRRIRVKPDTAASWKNLTLLISWDNAATPSICSPLDQGFGSRAQRTLLLGQSANGWRFCSLPMPFRKKAAISLMSTAAGPVNCEVELSVEEHAALPSDALFLHSFRNEGRFPRNGAFEKPGLPLKDFFYYNGYKALDVAGSGHIAAYMDLFACQPELDEHVFIDDERTFPDNSWNGTGHEDLFDMAWGHKPLTSPMTSGGSENFKEVNVKVFLNDPMTFRKAIRFNWEWVFCFGIPAPMEAHFASVVYWYSPAR